MSYFFTLKYSEKFRPKLTSILKNFAISQFLKKHSTSLKPFFLISFFFETFKVFIANKFRIEISQTRITFLFTVWFKKIYLMDQWAFAVNRPWYSYLSNSPLSLHPDAFVRWSVRFRDAPTKLFRFYTKHTPLKWGSLSCPRRQQPRIIISGYGRVSPFSRPAHSFWPWTLIRASVRHKI